MNKHEVKFNVLDRAYHMYAEELENATHRVLSSGWYILGKELETFEEEYAMYCGSLYSKGLNSGLDALILAVRALGIGKGDEVIVQANTYIATVLSITENGATPIFVEPDEYYNLDPLKLEEAITPKTKAIMPVHLYGQASQMDRIMEFAQRYDLFVIEDCAQSHSACYKGQMTGTFGNVGCFSFYPTKNLGAFGDAGAIVTDDSKIADTIGMLRNYGSKIKYHNEIEGVNSRLDEMQAALLRVKLKYLNQLTQEREYIAKRYLAAIKNEKILVPQTAPGADHVYHLFVIQTEERDQLQQYLLDNNIQTQIHYPIPPHLAECYKHLGYKKGDFPITERYANQCLSLPLYSGMTEEEIGYVVNAINKY